MKPNRPSKPPGRLEFELVFWGHLGVAVAQIVGVLCLGYAVLFG